jgi:hypothetical protein
MHVGEARMHFVMNNNLTNYKGGKRRRVLDH